MSSHALKAIRGGYKRTSESAKQMQSLTAYTIPQDDKRRNVSILDEEDPYSLISLVPSEFADLLRKIPLEYFGLSESELEARVKPSDTLSKLKLRFWDEWQTLLIGNATGKIPIASVYYGICTKEYFYSQVIKQDKNLAWIVTPPEDYVVTMRDVLKTGISRLKEIMKLPIVTETPIMNKKTGEPVINAKTGEPYVNRTIEKAVITEIRQIVNMLSDRVHGAVVQRFDINENSQSFNMHLSASAREALGLNAGDPMPAIDSNEDLLAIDKQLEKISTVLAPFDTPEKISVAQAKLDEEVIDVGGGDASGSESGPKPEA